ncbi:MAG: caspase family protein [Muribaculaceae bacterium]
MRQIVLMMLLCVVSVCGVSGQTRRALVIGIGEQEDTMWVKINGDKDVAYVEEMLHGAGYSDDNIIKLVNKEATKAAIVGAFRRLSERCEMGDVVYVHFSGHGQMMKDVHNDEKDGLDECWIPYDAYRRPCVQDRGEKHLTDDEVNVCLGAISDKIGDSGKMLVVIDACHSGDATRGDDDEVARGVGDVFGLVNTYVWDLDIEVGFPDYVNPEARENDERWITLSACQSGELNYEMRSPSVGKLTYALHETVKGSEGLDNKTYFRKVRMFIDGHTKSRTQCPDMTGLKNKYRILDIIR